MVFYKTVVLNIWGTKWGTFKQSNFLVASAHKFERSCSRALLLLPVIFPKSHKKLLKIIAPYFFLQNAIHLTIELDQIETDWNGLKWFEMY